MHAALSEDLAQHKKARWLTPAIFAILRGTPGGIFMHAALSEDLAQHKKARWLTPAIFAILRGTLPR